MNPKYNNLINNSTSQKTRRTVVKHIHMYIDI